MHSRNHLNFIIIALLLIGVLIFFYKIFFLNIPITKNNLNDIWKVEVEVSATPEQDKPIKINMLLPEDQKYFKVIDEKFVSPNYGQIVNDDKTAFTSSRTNIWTKRRAKQQESLFYSFTVIPKKNDLNNKAPHDYKEKKYQFSPAEQTASNTILKKAREQSADSPSFAANVVNILKNHNDDNSRFLLNNNYSDKNIAKTTIKILGLANIKSRIIEGFKLKANPNTSQNFSTNVPFDTLIQIWNGDDWVTLDIKNNKLGMPKDFFIWSYDNKFILKTEGIKNINFSISYKKQEIGNNIYQIDNSIFTKFSLLNLPIKTQKQFSVLITIPLGILVILILRSIVGLNTIGTFMPVLIAIAFRDTGLVLGLITFSLIIAIGLILRFYLENLKLLAIPRLGSVLAIVIFITIVLAIIFNELNIANPSAISVFPLVIITMTIERMAILWEEIGPSASLSQCAGSLLAASIIYIVINKNIIKHILFVFPELSAIIIALILLIGKYRGFRLSEIILFKQLVRAQ